jgi:hypothetical protein
VNTLIFLLARRFQHVYLIDTVEILVWTESARKTATYELWVVSHHDFQKSLGGIFASFIRARHLLYRHMQNESKNKKIEH